MIRQGSIRRRSIVMLAVALLACRSAPDASPSTPPEAAGPDPTSEPPTVFVELDPIDPIEEQAATEPADAFAVDSDDGVWGNLEGTSMGEAYGVGGLGQVGTGRGCTDCSPPRGLGLGTPPKASRKPPPRP